MPESPWEQQGDAVGGVCVSGEQGLTESQASTQSQGLCGSFQEPGCNSGRGAGGLRISVSLQGSGEGAGDQSGKQQEGEK